MNGTIINQALYFCRSQTEQKSAMSLHPPQDKNGHPAPTVHDKLKQRLRKHYAALGHLEKKLPAQSRAIDSFLQKVNSIILDRLGDEQFDTQALCRELLLSRSQLYRRLKPYLEQPPAQYIKFVRLQKAKELLEQPENHIGEVAFRTGFASNSHFTRSFQEQFGVSPSEFRRSFAQLHV